MTTRADTFQLTPVPIVNVGMLIRRPVEEVFEAFVDPAITTKFWFTHGSGRLEPGKRIEWRWEMYDVSVQVDVKEVVPNERILIEWPSYGHGTATVEWLFTPRPDGTTFVSVTNAGFSGTGDEIVRQALDSMGGFSLLTAGLKAYLEHGIELNLVADRFPPEIDET
jgi:uncharacterized protein YndB with AHSA1/START domain